MDLHADLTDPVAFLNDFQTVLSSFNLGSVSHVRKMMRKTGAVVTGDAALAILNDVHFLPDTLDFYVHPPKWALVFLFVESYGYKTVQFNHNVSFVNGEVKRLIVKLAHPVSRKVINIVIVFDAHLVNAITQLRSTVVMNYVAWYGLVSLYPDWTMEAKGLILTMDSITQEHMQEFQARGYTLTHTNAQLPTLDVENHQHICQFDWNCPQVIRSLYDGHCLFEPFGDVSGEINIETFEPLITWTLPNPCAFREEATLVVPIEDVDIRT